MTEAELHKILSGNPDLQVVGKQKNTPKKSSSSSKEDGFPTHAKAFAHTLQAQLERGDLLWYMYQPVIYKGRDWFTQEFVSSTIDSHTFWEWDGESYVSTDNLVRMEGYHPAGWTTPEWNFLNIELTVKLEKGVYEFVIPQLPIHMKGQRYTPDFVAIGKSQTDYFEVKGSKYYNRHGKKQGLGSDDRASVKIRWAAAMLGSPNHTYYWAREIDSGFKTRRISTKYPSRPILK